MAKKTAERIGPTTTGILLPVFFTYSGLNTCIGLLNSWVLWGICALVIVAAIAGKLIVCYGERYDFQGIVARIRSPLPR